MQIHQIAYVLILILAICFGYAKESEADKTPSLAFLQKVSGMLNEGLPQMIDQEVQLQSTFAQAGALGYYYVYVNYNADQLNGDYILANRSKVENYVCTNPRMSRFVKDNVDIIYSYYGRDGKYVTEIVVDVDKCKQLR